MMRDVIRRFLHSKGYDPAEFRYRAVDYVMEQTQEVGIPRW